ncbi:phage minor tail protein L [Moraxella caviae]|uniref:Phage minor tail protein L n=1 Tax=Moraxella caviae TaxID=34060 RepID=A0A1T0A4K1_9GAMM|nr:phage minor tail protein L [Moraxella caviae]OOR90241.1 phage minor tail protein L [Moraxella caviae]STZ14538.1 phage minor tail protein L [Moraxella caviae]VEW12543.1 phage minor tail protein L [Moraxella caviae]
MNNQDLQSLQIPEIITLYHLDADNVGAGQMYFHGHDGQIVWQGKTYEPVAIEADGLEMRGDGRASAPTLKIANFHDNLGFVISALCHRFHDLVGAKLTVIHTLAKHLKDPNAQHKKQIWFVEQMTEDNGQTVSFELSNPVDFEGLKIPVRQITGFCHWAVTGGYRGEECGYMGTAMFDENGNPTNDPARDKCGGRGFECKLRYGENSELSFGGFIASSM